MVSDESVASSNDEKPFGLRSTIYTIGFLILILGAVPSVFFLAGEWLTSTAGAIEVIRRFWMQFAHLVGIAVFTIGLGAYLFCSIWLIFFGRGPHVEFDPPRVFVATGPYRWVRNPVVITLMTTVLGEAVFLHSLGILVLFLIGMPLAHYQVTRIEEPRLRARFGAAYEDYLARVPRWVPKPPSASETPSSPSAGGGASSSTAEGL